MVVGDFRQSDCRKDLQGDPNLATQLTRSLQSDQLTLFTLDKRVTLHSKLYLVENRDGTRTLVLSSPTLSKRAWSGNQPTTIAAFRTDGNSIVDERFDRFYRAHRDQCERFLKALSERLETADSEDERQQELHLRVDGTVPSATPTGEVHRRIVETVDADETSAVESRSLAA